jgi:beta-glucosidase-like glycosyl hydrolase/CubicO group peptidase (beta-lactamase class C family)
MKYFFLIVLLSGCWWSLRSQEISNPLAVAWADSILTSMTTEEKVGQLFMIRSFSHEDKTHIQRVSRQIEKYKVGGICFFQGSPEKQSELVESYQKLSDLPMIIAIDGEWGLGMRFKEKALSFPKQLTIGAINDHQLIYNMGREIGRQMKLIGINVNFAPVLDVNNNPDNPVINYRSFGEDRYNVASKSYAYARGLQDAGVMPCAKHFPGHGDTATDSHYDLPVITHNQNRLDSIELYPFRMLIKEGLPAVMVAHLQIPALESRENRPSTVSKSIVSGLLRDKLGFDGLIYTDAMEMKGVTKHFQKGEAEVEAFLAGNDVLLLPENLDNAFSRMMGAIESGRISQSRLNESVVRILRAKYDMGLHKMNKYTEPANLKRELHSRKGQIIKSHIYEKAVTLVKNEQNFLPIREINGYKFASVALGSNKETRFQERLADYLDIENHSIEKSAGSEEYQKVLSACSQSDYVFVGIFGMNRLGTKNYGILNDQIEFVQSLAKKTNVLISIFGSPYAARFFESMPGLLIAFEDDPMAQDITAQALMGVTDITGRLPVSASKSLPEGSGITLAGLKRLGFSIPEAVGLNSDTLRKIETLVQEMIGDKAAPGCQILIAKDNKIVYWDAFGYHTYQKKNPVKKTDIFDIASVTKVCASTLSAIHLEDRGLFSLNDHLKEHFPEEDTTNKADLVFEDMLAHMASLKPWLPFYTNTLTKERRGKPDPKYYRHEQNDSFNIRVAPNLFLRTDYPDTIWREILTSDLREQNSYRYSDLAFYILSKTVHDVSGYPLDQYAHQSIYYPLGLRRTLYNPLDKIPVDEIVPSEKDDYYRMSIIQGTVHDMGAAMLGGVSGHAGLFSNAMELGIIMQMLLNRGYYGGKQFFRPQSIRHYTQRHWRSSRRGIGFDMKELNPTRRLNMSEKASRHTYGHLGFTGTAVFADPEYNIVYIFLSNRTFPTMDNNKLGKDNYRSDIQTIIYDALIPKEGV